MFQLYNYHEVDRTLFYDFLEQEALSSTDPAAKNMWDETAGNHSLPYILEKTRRFSAGNGEFNILMQDKRIIACAGVYKSNFSNTIALAGTRAWVCKEYRNKHILREYLLPNHKLWAIKNNFDIVAICFNEYNKNLIQVFKRTRLGESSARVIYKEPKHLFYMNMNLVEFPVRIQNTKQWVLYEKLNPSMDYNWNEIKYDLPL